MSFFICKQSRHLRTKTEKEYGNSIKFKSGEGSENINFKTSHFIFRVTAIHTYYPLTIMAKEMGVVDDEKTYRA